jgi:hypothetical protein
MTDQERLTLRPYLRQELFFPVVQVFEALNLRDIVHEDTAVGTSVERHTKRLKPLLSCCVPYLHARLWPVCPIFWAYSTQNHLEMRLNHGGHYGSGGDACEHVPGRHELGVEAGAASNDR